MANITPTLVRDDVPSRNVWVATWTGMGNADTGVAVKMGGAADRSVHVDGTFGGATVTIQGSNDGTNYYTLADPQGNVLTWTSSNRIETILELTRFVRAITSGGTGTSLTISLLLAGMVQ